MLHVFCLLLDSGRSCGTIANTPELILCTVAIIHLTGESTLEGPFKEYLSPERADGKLVGAPVWGAVWSPVQCVNAACKLFLVTDALFELLLYLFCETTFCI